MPTDPTTIALPVLVGLAGLGLWLGRTTAPAKPAPPSKREFYASLLQDVQGVLEGERNWIAGMANVSSLVFHALLSRQQPRVNWVGFYIRNNAEGQLLLGPFQGEIACVAINPGRGVCGTAAARKQTVVVPDVDRFAGHIACSDKTKSEIVVPMIDKQGNVLGVFDLDSVDLNGFDDEDRVGLEAIIARLMQLIDWPLTW